MDNLKQEKNKYANAITKAIIDIGTNSVKLLVARVDSHHIVPIRECAIQTRLGNNAFKSQTLQRDGLDKTLEAIEFFYEYSKVLGAQKVKIIGTSALRESFNRDELVEKVRDKTGLTPLIISGEDEAELAYYGVVSDTPFENIPVLIVEVGGGSSQFIIGYKSNLLFKKSYKIGAVRLMNLIHVSDPPKISEFDHCKMVVESEINQNVYPDIRRYIEEFRDSLKFVATGGTITILGKMKLQMEEYNREKLEGLEIKYEEICDLNDKIWKMTLKERQSLPGLPADRADIIIFGLQIFMGIMRIFKLKNVNLSVRGIRFGALKKF